MKLWVPCRAINKKYDAGKFGNTIAGGITNGETPLKTILTEAEEGLALSRDFIREHQGNVHPALFQSLFPRGRTPEAVNSVLTFELELPQDTLPSPMMERSTSFPE